MTDTAPAPAALRLAGWARASGTSALQTMLSVGTRPGTISFALGLPAPEFFPSEAYGRAAAAVLAEDPRALQYSPPSAPLQAHVAALMAQRGVACAPEQVFLTTGAQQGISLLARLLLEPGGEIITDTLCYTGFQQAVEPFAPRILTVPTDLDTGMDVDAVEALLAGGARPAFIYTVTDGHNPLAVSMSAEKRLRLVEIARRYGVPVVEDDPYGFLAYDGPPAHPLRALEREWVFYVGSFSKVMAPGFRAGWVIVPRELGQVMGCAKDGSDIDTSTFSQRLVSEYLSAGTFGAHLDRVRDAYRLRRDTMLAGIRRHFPAGTRTSVPRHGALLWAELPDGYDADALLRLSLETELVAYVPGSAFSFDGRQGKRGMRLNFSFPTLAQIEDGVARLGRVLREAAPRAAA